MFTAKEIEDSNSRVYMYVYTCAGICIEIMLFVGKNQMEDQN